MGWATRGSVPRTLSPTPGWPKAHARVVAACVQKCTQKGRRLWASHIEKSTFLMRRRQRGRSARRRGPLSRFYRSCREEWLPSSAHGRKMPADELAPMTRLEPYLLRSSQPSGAQQTSDDADYVVRKEELSTPSQAVAASAWRRRLQKTDRAEPAQAEGRRLVSRRKKCIRKRKRHIAML